MSCMRSKKMNTMVNCDHHDHCNHFVHCNNIHICMINDTIENQECPELPDPPNGQVHLTGRHFQVIFIKSACVHVYIDIEIEVIQTHIPEKLENPISETLADIFSFMFLFYSPISHFQNLPNFVETFANFFYSIWEPQFYALALNSTMHINQIGRRRNGKHLRRSPSERIY